MNRLDFLKVLALGFLFKDWKPFQSKLLMPRVHLKTFSLGFTVTDEMLKDDMYGTLSAKRLAAAHRDHIDALMKEAA